MLRVLVGVTPHQGARESRAQGEVAQVVGCPGAVRYARCETPKQDWSLFERCSKEATGELLEIERLTSSLERGHWKSTREGNSLVAYSTARRVWRGGWRKRTSHEAPRPVPTLRGGAVAAPGGPAASAASESATAPPLGYQPQERPAGTTERRHPPPAGPAHSPG